LPGLAGLRDEDAAFQLLEQVPLEETVRDRLRFLEPPVPVEHLRLKGHPDPGSLAHRRYVDAGFELDRLDLPSKRAGATAVSCGP